MSMVQLQSASRRLNQSGAWNLPVERIRSQSCSDFVSPCATQAVLFVGAERVDEFADATRLARDGHDVIVVNPRETAAARAFRRAGGTFLRAGVEQLPRACCRFDVICEN